MWTQRTRRRPPSSTKLDREHHNLFVFNRLCRFRDVWLEKERVSDFFELVVTEVIRVNSLGEVDGVCSWQPVANDGGSVSAGFVTVHQEDYF